MAFDSIRSQSFQYSPLSRLNTLEVWHDQTAVEGQQGLWIVYIHGGAWRDPAIDASSIQTTISRLSSVFSHIKGIASLNYRLSPHLKHETSPGGDDPSRNAKHPQHIEDILTALCWLQHMFGFEQHYILLGHSAGATLAFQSITGYWSPRNSTTDYPLSGFVPPVAIAGVAGIYDLPALVESFSSIPAYKEFVEAAFGEDEQIWRKASPANAEIRSGWTNAKLAIIAHSENDELIDKTQSERMWAQLNKQNNVLRKDIQLKLYGDHDCIWKEGSELANVIIHAIHYLKGNL